MTEHGFVEKPILEWLAGKSDDATDVGMGWTYRSPEMMDTYDREITDPLVDGILIPAIMRINASVDTEEQARKVISLLRGTMAAPDLLTANRDTLDALANGIPVVLRPGEDATDGSQSGSFDEESGDGAGGDGSRGVGTLPVEDEKTDDFTRSGDNNAVSADLTGAVGPDDTAAKMLVRNLPEESESNIAYEDIQRTYTEQIERALVRSDVPIAMRVYVRDYFLRIGEQRSSDGRSDDD